MSSFPNLLREGRIGSMTVRNRLVMSPMETMYGTPDGLPSQRTLDYFAARAKGLFDDLTDWLPGAKVHAVGDCTGLGLIRKATDDGARAACSI